MYSNYCLYKKTIPQETLRDYLFKIGGMTMKIVEYLINCFAVYVELIAVKINIAV